MEPEPKASSRDFNHSSHDIVTGISVTSAELRAEQETYKAALAHRQQSGVGGKSLGLGVRLVRPVGSKPTSITARSHVLGRQDILATSLSGVKETQDCLFQEVPV